MWYRFFFVHLGLKQIFYKRLSEKSPICMLVSINQTFITSYWISFHERDFSYLISQRERRSIFFLHESDQAWQRIAWTIRGQTGTWTRLSISCQSIIKWCTNHPESFFVPHFGQNANEACNYIHMLHKRFVHYWFVEM